MSTVHNKFSFHGNTKNLKPDGTITQSNYCAEHIQNPVIIIHQNTQKSFVSLNRTAHDQVTTTLNSKISCVTCAALKLNTFVNVNFLKCFGGMLNSEHLMAIPYK